MKPHPTFFLSCLVMMVACLFQGCQTTRGVGAAEQYNASPLMVSVPPGISPDQVEHAMVRAMLGRQWVVTERSPNQVVGVLDHRGYRGRVTMERRGDTIVLLNSSTEWSSKSKQYVPAVPSRWLAYLQKDLRQNLSSATVTSFH